ncbi:MAG: 6-carboxytetrahydropterin synthase [Acidobacteriota bacterium]
MSYPSRFILELAKEDFKFSSAHFTLFGPDEAERLHGHNYRVRLQFEGDRVDDLGLLVDFVRTKKAIRALCEHLDTMTLLPGDCPLLALRQLPPSTPDAADDAGDWEVLYGPRRYVLPAADVLVLPLANTTIELFAAWIWRELAAEVMAANPLVDVLTVSVGETDGQTCAYRAPLPRALSSNAPT